MDGAPLLLASASPRRRRLISWLGPAFETASVEVEEDLGSPLKSLPPILARSLAADKARAARAEAGPAPVIIACDTLVLLDRTVLGKPIDREDAERMLRSLSGRVHEVITGVAIAASGSDDPRTFAVTTPVTMHDLDDARISEWTASDEVLGCAGAYNIERHLASVGEDECYQNVAGLPLCHLRRELDALGVCGLSSPVRACEEARGVRCGLGASIAGRD